MDAFYNQNFPIWLNILNWLVIIFSAVIVWRFQISGFVDDEPFTKIYTEDDNFMDFELSPFESLIWMLVFSVILAFFLASLPSIILKAPSFDSHGFFVFLQRTVAIFFIASSLFLYSYRKWKKSKKPS